MNALPVHTYADIMALEPCFDPVERGYCSSSWVGTALDVLRHPHVSAAHKLWLVLRSAWLPERLLHEFFVWCADWALKLVDNPDPRFVAALDVKRRWLRGEATDDELAVAWDATRDVVWNADWTFVGSVSWDDTWAYDWDGTWDIIGNADLNDNWAAICNVAGDVAWNNIEKAVWDATLDAFRAAQVDQLILMIESA